MESYKVGAIINPLNRLGMEEKMATHSKILARGNPTDRGAWLVGYSPWGPKESDMAE